MRNLMIILALFAMTVAFASGNTTTHKYQIGVDVDEMEQGTDALINVLQERMSGPIGMYYTSTLEYVKISSVAFSILHFVLVILFIFFFVFCINRIKNKPDIYTDVVSWWTGAIVSILLSLVFASLAVSSVVDYYCSEYVAMNKVIKMALKFVE